MGHIPYVPSGQCSPQSLRGEFPPFTWLRIPEEAPRKGSTLGPSKTRGQRRVGRGEDGAETVEFAIVVVLLIALLYGIVALGLSLAAKVTVTQAASDGARAGIVMSTPALQISTAQTAAASDVSWMGRGTCSPTGTTITCFASEAACAANSNQTCLTVVVTYNYAKSPLFPPLPGLGVLAPNTIMTSSTLQVSTPSS
jgi:Flp pilus assembly protein TadG